MCAPALSHTSSSFRSPSGLLFFSHTYYLTTPHSHGCFQAKTKISCFDRLYKNKLLKGILSLCEGQRLQFCSFLCPSLPYSLPKDFSIKPFVTRLAVLAGQNLPLPRIFLSLPNQSWSSWHAPTTPLWLDFYVFSGCLNSGLCDCLQTLHLHSYLPCPNNRDSYKNKKKKN